MMQINALKGRDFVLTEKCMIVHQFKSSKKMKER